VSFWDGIDASTLDIGVGDKVHGLWNQFSNTLSNVIPISIGVNYQNMTGRTIYVTVFVSKLDSITEFASFYLATGSKLLDQYMGTFHVSSQTKMITLKGFVPPGAFFYVQIDQGNPSNFSCQLTYTN